MDNVMLDKKNLKPGVIRAAVFTALAIFLVLGFGFPAYYAVILIAFFWIRVFPFTKLIDRKLTELHSGYGTSHHLIRKAVPYAIYIVFLIAVKIFVVDIVMTEILQIPVREQLYGFLNIPQS